VALRNQPKNYAEIKKKSNHVRILTAGLETGISMIFLTSRMLNPFAFEQLKNCNI
jgi:hypothetical protein